MKQLLVPTDFSDHAETALDYAVHLANAFGGTVHLLHGYKAPHPTGVLKNMSDILEQEAKDEGAKLLEKYQPQLRNGAQLKLHLRESEPISLIVDAAKKLDVDMIVMGTQGASGLVEVFLGSNTSGVLKETNKPVLAIPKGFSYRPIQKIAFPVDENGVENVEALATLKAIAEISAASVMIYHLETRDGDSGIHPSVTAYLEGITQSYHYELSGDTINQAINEFVKDYQADMICMIHRKRHLMNRLFHVSVTTKEILNSPVPLLVVKG